MSETATMCACTEQATEGELLARLDEVLEEYKDKPGDLIPVLQIAQGIFGYLPENVLKRIALALGKSYSEVAGVVGFYSFFSTVPRGKHLVRVCLGTACYVRGGKLVLEALKQELGIDVGGTTAGPAVLPGGGPVLRRLRPGAHDHDRRGRPPAGEAGQDPRDPRAVPRTATAARRRQRQGREGRRAEAPRRRPRSRRPRSRRPPAARRPPPRPPTKGAKK